MSLLTNSLEYASNIVVDEVPRHRLLHLQQIAWLQLDAKDIGRSIIAVSEFDRSYYTKLPEGQSYFRVVSNISDCQPLIKIDRKSGKVYFLKDYDADDESGTKLVWRRGRKARVVVHDRNAFFNEFREDL